MAMKASVIRRFAFGPHYQGPPLFEDAKGPYVLHEDHVVAIEALLQERDNARSDANLYKQSAAEAARGLECLSDIDDAWDSFGTRGNPKVLTLAEQICSLTNELDAAYDQLSFLKSQQSELAAGNGEQAKRDWRQRMFYPIVIPVTAEGEGPAEISEATKLIYEVWDRDCLSYGSFETLLDAINHAESMEAAADRRVQAKHQIADGTPVDSRPKQVRVSTALEARLLKALDMKAGELIAAQKALEELQSVHDALKQRISDE